MKNIGANKAKIKEILPHGSLKIIAKRAGVTIYTVSRVISGKSNNQKVLLALNSYIEELRNNNITLENNLASIC